MDDLPEGVEYDDAIVEGIGQKFLLHRIDGQTLGIVQVEAIDIFPDRGHELHLRAEADKNHSN